MPASPTDIFALWEESLLALSRYCTHYGLDDDDERAIRNYLDSCALSGRPPLAELINLIKAQGQLPVETVAHPRIMTLQRPQWHWVSYGDIKIDKKVRHRDAAILMSQLKTQTEIDVRKMQGATIENRFLLEKCLEINVRILEIVPEMNVMSWLWWRLRGVRRFKILVYAKWHVASQVPIEMSAFQPDEVVLAAQSCTLPKSLDAQAHHKIIDTRLLSEESDVLMK